jgi:hypothetical protein
VSIIFSPIDSRVPPQYVDGVENLVTRVQGLSTNSLAFATVGQVEIAPNVFSNNRNNSRVEFEFSGQTPGVAGTKQFRGQVDGVTFYTTASFNTSINPGTFRIRITIVFRNGQFAVFMRSAAGDSASGSLALNSLGSAPAGFANFDSSISHTVTLQALVANAADSVRCDWIGGSFR